MGPQEYEVKKLILAACAVLLTLGGCKALESHETTARLAVTYGTVKYLETRAEKKAEVVRVAEEIKAAASGESVTLAALEAAAMAHVAKIDSIADRMLATELVRAISAELAARTSGGVLSPDDVVYVQRVMDWVLAATIYVPDAA